MQRLVQVPPVAHMLKVLEITEILLRNVLCDGDSVTVMKNKDCLEIILLKQGCHYTFIVLHNNNYTCIINKYTIRVDRLFERQICSSHIEVACICSHCYTCVDDKL